MDWDGVLVRFGEIGIKSGPVRRQMLERLRQNLLDLMLRRRVEGNVHRIGARLWMQGADADALAAVASRCFGVVSASPARRVSAALPALGEAAATIALAAGRDWSSFAIRAHREGAHDFTSQDVGREVGSAVWTAAEAAGRTPRVDLSRPDLAIHVDVRGGDAFVFTVTVAGPGGLPMGSQGKVVALLSDRASFVAAWLMMRRGCDVVPVHAGQAQSLPSENFEAMQSWGLGADVDLLPICTGFVGKPTLLAAAWTIARRVKALAVVTGDTLASDLRGADGVIVLRPVCGLVPAQVAAYADRVGLADDEPEHILDDASHETVESALSMHRVVTV
jgi:thiamine biosynthesis protein ThiI